jgi:hypothetical protein
MQYHSIKRILGIRGNLKALFCRLFGHRLNENASHGWCGRCGLAYSECYYPVDYHEASGLIDITDYDRQGGYIPFYSALCNSFPR